jgi:hypothetical protein
VIEAHADDDRDDRAQADGVEERPLVERGRTEQIEAHDRSHRREEEPPSPLFHL